jgi:hypothetical protein
MARPRLVTFAWLAAGAMLLVALARGLRPESFWAGDSGAKLVAARAALADPRHPLDIPLPVIGAAAAPDLIGPFYVPHRDHAHALTSPLFPLISAPALALGGLRGLYLLPALAWLLTLWLAARVSKISDPETTPTWGVGLLAVGTPLLFYALEFWEHTPAAALTTAATLAALPTPTRPRSWALAGALIGIAFLLRPEALWYGLALVATAPKMRLSPMLARLGRFAAGFALTQLPVVVYYVAHFGTLTGPHLAANARAATADWLSLRIAIAWLWFGDGSGHVVAALLLGAALAAATALTRNSTAPRVAFAGTFLVVAASLWITAQAVLRGLPREGLWATFPALGLALLPIRPAGADSTEGDGSETGHGSFLRGTALLFVALAWLTAPNDGGAQWGPRYLLPACVPLALVAAPRLRALESPGPWRGLVIACAAVFALGSLWVQRSMYRELRISKSIHARIASAVGTQAADARVVLTDVPSLDLLAASQGPRLTFLCARSTTQARSALERLQSAAVSPVLIVRSATESTAGPNEDWLAGNCYRVQASAALEDRDLRFSRVACGPL